MFIRWSYSLHMHALATHMYGVYLIFLHALDRYTHVNMHRSEICLCVYVNVVHTLYTLKCRAVLLFYKTQGFATMFVAVL